jgi:flagellar basal-body rod protein FlgB
MLERLLSSKTALTAEGAMNGLSSRFSALSHNIANQNTPNYKREFVNFESELSEAMNNATSPCTGSVCSPHEPFHPTVQKDTATVGGADGNNVDIEREMVQLTDTDLRFQALTQYVSGYYSGLKNVINQSR